MESLPWIVALVALVLLGARAGRMGLAVARREEAAAAADRVGAHRQTGLHDRRAARLPPAARSAAAPHRAVQAAAGALLPAHRPAGSPLLVRTARRQPRHLRDLQRQRPGARGHRPRHRPRQFAPVLQIKQSVLGACRVRYLRCPVDHLPTVAELQLLVPSSAAPARGPQPPAAPPYD